jgi:hypothetical protein
MLAWLFKPVSVCDVNGFFHERHVILFGHLSHICRLWQFRTLATCSMKEYLGAESTEESAAEEIVKNIYDSSLPLFRRTIESGRVRLSFLDYRDVRRA